MQRFGFLVHLRLTRCNMLISRFPGGAAGGGFGSAESRSCSASGGMSGLFLGSLGLCPIRAWGRCMPGTSVQRAQLLPGLAGSARRALGSVRLPHPVEGQEAPHAVPGAVSSRPTARRCTLCSLPLFPPLFLLITELIQTASLSVEIGQWI